MFAYVYIHVSLKGRDVYHHILYAKSMVGNTNKDLLYRTTRKYFSRGKKKCRHILRRHILGIKYIGQERTTRKFSKVWEVTRFVTTFLFDKVLSRKRIRSYSSREHSQWHSRTIKDGQVNNKKLGGDGDDDHETKNRWLNVNEVGWVSGIKSSKFLKGDPYLDRDRTVTPSSSFVTLRGIVWHPRERRQRTTRLNGKGVVQGTQREQNETCLTKGRQVVEERSRWRRKLWLECSVV